MQLVIIAVVAHQIIVGAALDDLTFVDDIDHVGILDGRQPVSDGNRGAGLHQLEECVLHKPLALCVKG